MPRATCELAVCPNRPNHHHRDAPHTDVISTLITSRNHPATRRLRPWRLFVHVAERRFQNMARV
ncbi:MAG: hypothetical protein ACREJO_12035 [Phycisphaerales bacterium]